jgi:putative phosphoribosyl transferase
MLFRPSFYKDRHHAGTLLARILTAPHSFDLILALPRGGIPVAIPIAKALKKPLNIFITRKIGHPRHSEFALGALAEPQHQYLSKESLAYSRVSLQDIKPVIARETVELQRRVALYRRSLPFPEVESKRLLLVDDGIATGATIFAAIESLELLKAAKITVATPVAHPNIAKEIRRHTTLITLHEPPDLTAIGSYYANFSQLNDQEVISMLNTIAQV